MAEPAPPSSPTEPPQRNPSWLFWLFAFCFVTSLIYLKVYSQARRSFQQAEKKLEAGAVLGAIRDYGLTVRWYTPGNPYVRVAVKRLLSIGEVAYRNGDWEQAISSFQHLRNALSSLRGVVQPYTPELEKSQKRLAEVMSYLPPPVVAQVPDRLKRQRAILKRLQEHELPSAVASLVAVLGYLLWLGSAGWLCWSWTQQTPTTRLIWAGGALVALVTWLLALGWC